MSPQHTPGHHQRVRLERALAQFEVGRGRLDDVERSAFAHGWLAGDDGRPLPDVLAELDPRHRDYGRLAPLIALGHHGGYSAFLREEPDYQQAAQTLAEDLGQAQPDRRAAAAPSGGQASRPRGPESLLESLASWLERRF